ncbi:hypothetical protein TNCV_1446121 [Trichonephila clavipes]|nr:hypothetical protein TNCV_1446121 [Trichonephila clavipes]
MIAPVHTSPESCTRSWASSIRGSLTIHPTARTSHPAISICLELRKTSKRKALRQTQGRCDGILVQKGMLRLSNQWNRFVQTYNAYFELSLHMYLQSRFVPYHFNILCICY